MGRKRNSQVTNMEFREVYHLNLDLFLLGKARFIFVTITENAHTYHNNNEKYLRFKTVFFALVFSTCI